MYQDDERNGYGEMCWTDGSVYKGEWKKGIQNGRGVMTMPDGRIKDGIFEANIFKGAVKVREGSDIERKLNVVADEGSSVDGTNRRGPRDMRIRGTSNSIDRMKKMNETQSIQPSKDEELSPVFRTKVGHSPEQFSTQSNKVQRPSILKPVIPPKKRDGSQYSG